MKKVVISFLLCFFSTQLLIAQAPNWSVNENEYQYTMTLVAKINVDGKQLIGAEDRVAAFVGSVCRGVSGVTYVASKKNYYVYLTVFSNQQGEIVTFKLYDKSTNKVTSVTKPIPFVVNEHRGSLLQSYSIAEPTLSSNAEINTFGFLDVPSISSDIAKGVINISISEKTSANNLKPLFTLSKGATLFQNGIVQKSGEDIKNFSTVISYDVLSEDESNLNNYKVYVTRVSDPTLFYKKDAVCYARGAIKVTSKQEGAIVKLSANGALIASKQIVKGEALFTELNVGTYVAALGNDLKTIAINLKDK
jgi:hypothetical protein